MSIWDDLDQFLICLRKKHPDQFNECMLGNGISDTYRIELDKYLDSVEVRGTTIG